MAKIPTTSTTLLRDLARDSQHARWGEFVARYRPMMESYLRERFPAVDADEAVQETLIALIRALPVYRYVPEETGHFRSYLTGIAFVLPTLVVLLLMMFTPLLRTFVYSVSKIKFPALTTTFNGLNNFKKAFSYQGINAVLRKAAVVARSGDMLYGGRLFDDLFYQLLLERNPGLSAQLEREGNARHVHWLACRRAKEDFSDADGLRAAQIMDLRG